MELGEKAADFKLKGTDGKTHALADYGDKPVLIVVFSCNHCPYVVAYEDRMIAIQRDYAAKGVQLLAINSNDAEEYPEDSFAEMVKRAKEKSFDFPYLRDDSQAVARAYGATHTPHLFVFDKGRTLAYTGKIDDNWQEPAKVKQRYLRDALDALVGGKKPSEPETHAIGCTIKWKR